MTTINLTVVQGDTLNLPVQIINPNVLAFNFTGLVVRLQGFTSPTGPIVWEASNGTPTVGLAGSAFTSITPIITTGAVQATVQATAQQTAAWDIGLLKIDLSVYRLDMGHYTAAQYLITVTPSF